MKLTLRTIMVAAVLATAALSMAQGRGGGMMMRGGPGGGSPTMLLMREDVQKELKLTNEQKNKLDDLRQSSQDKMREMFQNGQGGNDREAMQAEMQKLMAQQEKDTNAVLTADQQKRLKELWIQRSGANVITNEGIQKDLGITDAQKAKIKEVMDASREAMQGLFEKMRNQEIDRDEFRAAMTKNNDALKEKLKGVLTADQAAKLRSMEGTAFKFDEDGQ